MLSDFQTQKKQPLLYIVHKVWYFSLRFIGGKALINGFALFTIQIYK